MADDGQHSTRRSSEASNVNNSMTASIQSISLSQQLSQHGNSDATPRRRPQASRTQTREYGSINTPTASRQPPEGTGTPRPKPPAPMRRTTSMQRPHRDMTFSVDDAEDELEQELQAQQRQAKHAAATLRRQPSTVRRRTAPVLARVDSEVEELEQEHAGAPTDPGSQQPESDDTLQPEEEEELDAPDDDDEDLSDAESFTLRDRQQAINTTHPFGIRIWKPALYKKDRSVQKTAEDEIHSTPGAKVSKWLLFFNCMWTIVFGVWLSLLAGTGGLICLCLGFFDCGCMEYGKVLWGLAGYLLYPFGKYVKLIQEEAYAEEDEGEGRSISEYEQWQSGDIEEGRLFFGPTRARNPGIVGRRRESMDSADETQSLLGRGGRSGSGDSGSEPIQRKKRLFGRGEWTLGRVIFFVFFYFLITPSLFLICGICWLFVFTIPMGKVTMLLFHHLRRHPLALSFNNNNSSTRTPGESSAILLCTYRAVGTKYWKYTIDGTNIFLINLLAIVAFAIFDYWILDVTLGFKHGITSPGFVFMLSLFSIIPLAYFIGQAVASISAQSSMGVGATINAFFSTVVEVFLYCVALNQGKSQLVEGSIIGSIFAGILFLPGISMCFGALRRKTQRFNVKSAGVTSTMLLFAVIAAFGPTLFWQIYGNHELICHKCVIHGEPGNFHRDCRACYFSQGPAIRDKFWRQAVRPFTYFAASLLFLSYVIGLLFTLRTHAAVIWASELDEKKLDKMEQSGQMSSMSTSAILNAPHAGGHGTVHGPHAHFARNLTTSSIGTLGRNDIRESQLYKRILGQSLKQVGLNLDGNGSPTDSRKTSENIESRTPHVPPPRDDDSRPTSAQPTLKLATLTEEENQTLVRQVAEMAATAATVAARDATKAPHTASIMASTPARPPSITGRPPSITERPQPKRSGTLGTFAEEEHGDAGHTGGGHDAPNWSRTKSAVILLTATIAYAVIAEILVDTVDAVLEHVDIDEKFLGITLFALVPNTTEFLNAISFAMNGNIALSMEIGSAYALQVCLLQIPALVLYSAIHGRWIDPKDVMNHTFTLIFPQWDMVTVILCVFLLSYMYGEGKSNYFKGSILILSYLVVVVGFYFSGFDNVDIKEVDLSDTLALGQEALAMKFGTKGFGRSSGYAREL